MQKDLKAKKKKLQNKASKIVNFLIMRFVVMVERGWEIIENERLKLQLVRIMYKTNIVFPQSK